MRILMSIAIGLLSLAYSAYAVEKDPSPLSSNGYVVQFSENAAEDIQKIASDLSHKNLPKNSKPLVFKLSRVTDPSTPQPGEPMPGYPPTGEKHIIDTLFEAIKSGRSLILVPTNESMTGRLGGATILGPGGATVFFTAPGKQE